ncbi:hypothetical protein PC115_g372 [Phytophthora cactorum]|uniref:Uncharacterized protein n=1 Tax=Phytophthora cactorum TaxID=29920 RepID=A0A8T1DTT6_9STRA|nr:hypothetical protein PC115_g372 [Phytophthora cactorum]
MLPLAEAISMMTSAMMPKPCMAKAAAIAVPRCLVEKNSRVVMAFSTKPKVLSMVSTLLTSPLTKVHNGVPAISAMRSMSWMHLLSAEDGEGKLVRGGVVGGRALLVHIQPHVRKVVSLNNLRGGS